MKIPEIKTKTDAVELIMAVEEEFDIEIPDDKATEIKTVQDIVA